jgi:hypothetical protein
MSGKIFLKIHQHTSVGQLLIVGHWMTGKDSQPLVQPCPCVHRFLEPPPLTSLISPLPRFAMVFLFKTNFFEKVFIFIAGPPK